MTTLHGRIEEGVLANILQYLALSQATGCLLLRHPQNRQGSIYLERGRVVFVEAKPSYDVAALVALLRWRDGQFSFRPGVAAPRVTLDRSTATLLLEATHLADEADGGTSRGGQQVDADTVLSAVAANQRSAAVPGMEPPARPTGEGRAGVGRSSRRYGSSDTPRPYAVPLPGARPGAVPAVEGARPRGAADVATVATDAGAETVALSLSALLLYRRLDGQRSLREHAKELDREPAEMVRAGRELLSAQLAEYVTLVVADPRFVIELAREAVDLLGPVGEIVVEDALYDLGLSSDALPVSAVDEFVRELCNAFKNAFTRADFMRRVTELRRLYALEPREPGRTG